MTMTLAEKIAVMQAAERGEKIEVRAFDRDDWHPCECPAWNWEDFVYRPVPPEPDEVPWHMINAKWMWYARDKDGRGFLFNEKPRLGKMDSWICLSGDYYHIGEVIDIKASGQPWRDSLQKRPESA